MHYEKEWQYMMSYDAIIATTEMLMQSDKKFKPNSAAGTLGITIYLSMQMHSAIL
jgi:hypothetical protein